MKSKFLIGLLLVPGLCFANPVNDMVHTVFNKLIKQEGLVNTQLKIIPDQNRFSIGSENNTVFLGTGAIRFMHNSPDIIAALIGHELSHIKYNIHTQPGKLGEQIELKCDILGRDMANRAGYNGSKGVCIFMKESAKVAGNPPKGGGYPTWEQRMSNIGCR